MDDQTATDMELFKSYMSDPAARAAFVDMKAQHEQAEMPRRYARVLQVVGSRPWAIEEGMLAVIVDILTFRAYGGKLSAAEIEARVAPSRRNPQTAAPMGVARIPVSGVIVPRASAFSDMSGGTSAEELSQSIRNAALSPSVGSIVLDVDSPGGQVGGVPELAAVVREARELKPVVAVANHEALSAAYWIASQADRIIASPSARVGSIGVIAAHEDRSQQAANEGTKTTLVTAGRFKGEGNPFEPLSEEARDHLQSEVNSLYEMFVGDVAAGRRVMAADVKANMGEGRAISAKQALDKGMIDGIDTVENVIAGELRNIEDQRQQMAAVRVDRQKFVAQTGANGAGTYLPPEPLKYAQPVVTDIPDPDVEASTQGMTDEVAALAAELEALKVGSE